MKANLVKVNRNVIEKSTQVVQRDIFSHHILRISMMFSTATFCPLEKTKIDSHKKYVPEVFSAFGGVIHINISMILAFLWHVIVCRPPRK